VKQQRRLFAGLALIVAIAVVIAVVLVTEGTSPTPSAGAATDAAGSGDATVQRRNLVETDTESGTLSYAGAHTVYNRLSGTITWLPSVGQLIRPGGTLFRIENEPVVLLDGSTPVYRTLSASDSDGPDILQLNRNLVRLGFNPDGIVVDDVWQPATTAGVEQFQASLGEAETGALTLGQVVFLPGPQLVSTVDGTVGSTGGGSGGAGSASSTSFDPPAPSAEFVDLTKPSAGRPRTTTTSMPTTTAPSRTTTTPPGRGSRGRAGSSGPSTQSIEQQIQSIIAALRAEAAALRTSRQSNPSRPSSSPSSSAASSSGHSDSPATAPASPILSTTSDRLVVTVDLPASSQSEARVGDRVSVELPDSSTVAGRVSAISPVATSSSSGSGGGGGGGGGGGSDSGGSGSSATVPVTISFAHAISGKGLDQAAVSVLFSQARANHVLSVPVTALVATSGNSYAVQEAAAPHRLVPVTTGLFAAGYVQVSGPGIYAGLEVTDSQG